MEKLKFPEKYIVRGRRLLHSGDATEIFYDVNGMLTNDLYLDYLVRCIPISEHYIGIATAGEAIALVVHDRRRRKDEYSLVSFVKDGELKGPVPDGDYVLIDDVVTTERSLNEAVGIIGKTPFGIYVAVDRRNKNKNLRVESIFGI